MKIDTTTKCFLGAIALAAVVQAWPVVRWELGAGARAEEARVNRTIAEWGCYGQYTGRCAQLREEIAKYGVGGSEVKVSAPRKKDEYFDYEHSAWTRYSPQDRQAKGLRPLCKMLSGTEWFLFYTPETCRRGVGSIVISLGDGQ